MRNVFVDRLLYCITSKKFISFVISALAIFVVLKMNHVWANVTSEIYKTAILAIKDVGIAILAVRGVQNVVEAVIDGKKPVNNDNESDK